MDLRNCSVQNSIKTLFEEGKAEGKELGLRKAKELNFKKSGIEKGKQQQKVDIAIALLDVLDNETIALKTGLSVTEVLALKAKK